MLKIFASVVIGISLLLPQTVLAGVPLGRWKVTRYYTPVAGQDRYYNGWKKGRKGQCATVNLYFAPYNGERKGDYGAEKCMQGQGDVFVTADGTDVRTQEPFTIAACPPKFLGETLHIENIGYVTCRDTGGAIIGRKIDVWAGVGDEGYENIASGEGGDLFIHLLQNEKTVNQAKKSE